MYYVVFARLLSVVTMTYVFKISIFFFMNKMKFDFTLFCEFLHEILMKICKIQMALCMAAMLKMWIFKGYFSNTILNVYLPTKFHQDVTTYDLDSFAWFSARQALNVFQAFSNFIHSISLNYLEHGWCRSR